MTMLGHREVIGLVVIVGLASGVVVEAVAMEAPSVKDDADDEDSEGIESAVHLLRRSREKWPSTLGSRVECRPHVHRVQVVVT